MKKTTFRQVIEKAKELNGTELYQTSDLEHLANEFQIDNVYWDENERLKEAKVQVWICTDTWVGTTVYFLDDEPIAIGIKTARKSTEEITYLSKDSVDKTRNYFLSLQDNVNICIMSDDELNEEMNSFYETKYACEILHKYGLVWNSSLEKYEVVEVLRKACYYDSDDFFTDKFHDVHIKYLEKSKNAKIIIDNREIKFLYGQKLDEIPQIN